MVVLFVVDEDGGRKAPCARVVFLRAALAQTAHIVDSQLRHRLDAAAIGEVCVGQHLLRLAAQARGDASDCGRELFAVIGGLRHLHVHDQRLRRVGRDLHVVVGRDAAVGLPHPARFRFAHAHPHPVETPVKMLT